MKASIIIPTYNEERALPQLFASLKAQTFRDFEVIVADAHSKDGTRTVALGFGAKIVDGGLPGVGRNRGAEIATGEVLVFFDADVVLPCTTYLEDALKEFDERQLDIATCPIKPESHRFSDRAMLAFYNLYTRVTAPVLPHVAGFCIFVKHQAHKQVEGFDERVLLAEDMDYARRIAKAGKFGLLHCHHIPMNVRRFERDGRFRTAVRFVLAELYMVFVGSIKTDIFKYRFGHDDTKDV